MTNLLATIAIGIITNYAPAQIEQSWLKVTEVVEVTTIAFEYDGQQHAVTQERVLSRSMGQWEPTHTNWRKLRAEVIAERPWCAACGYTNNLEGHHIIPRHVAPELALVKQNVIVLCRKYDCHLRIGHFGNYKRYWNKDVREILGDRGRLMLEAEKEHKHGE